MWKKIVAVSTWMSICAMLCSCFSGELSEPDSKTEASGSNSASTFPLKEDGYPEADYITVNGEPYLTQVKNRDTNPEEILEIRLENTSDSVIIVLPQCASILKWTAEEVDENLELVESRIYLPDSGREYKKEGESPYLYEFTFAVKDPQQAGNIVFKLVNVDSSVDPDGYYTLTAAITFID